MQRPGIVDAAFDRGLRSDLGGGVTVRGGEVLENSPSTVGQVHMRTETQKVSRTSLCFQYSVLTFLEFWKIHNFFGIRGYVLIPILNSG